MTDHAHRCALVDADHAGPCVCVCGAVVEAVPAIPYTWHWLTPDGTLDPFPGPSWRPRRFPLHSPSPQATAMAEMARAS